MNVNVYGRIFRRSFDAWNRLNNSFSDPADVFQLSSKKSLNLVISSLVQQKRWQRRMNVEWRGANHINSFELGRTKTLAIKCVSQNVSPIALDFCKTQWKTYRHFVSRICICSTAGRALGKNHMTARDRPNHFGIPMLTKCYLNWPKYVDDRRNFQKNNELDWEIEWFETNKRDSMWMELWASDETEKYTTKERESIKMINRPINL